MKVKAIVAAMVFAVAGVASAATNMVVGVNQNNNQEAVGTDKIVAVWHSGGVTSYKSSQFGGVFTITDATQSQLNKIVASFGTNAVASGGVTYNGARISTTCQNSNTVLSYDTLNPVNVPDNCALHNAAVARANATN